MGARSAIEKGKVGRMEDAAEMKKGIETIKEGVTSFMANE